MYNGQIDFAGAYNSLDLNNPLFDFKYDMSDVNFTKIFEGSKSFRLLAPVAEYVDGIFNSNLIISGPLGKDMKPDLTKVTASGYMETIKGQVVGFEPLKKIVEVLGIESINNWEIKDSKNWFEMKDGREI